MRTSGLIAEVAARVAAVNPASADDRTILPGDSDLESGTHSTNGTHTTSGYKVTIEPTNANGVISST